MKMNNNELSIQIKESLSIPQGFKLYLDLREDELRQLINIANGINGLFAFFKVIALSKVYNRVTYLFIIADEIFKALEFDESDEKVNEKVFSKLCYIHKLQLIDVLEETIFDNYAAKPSLSNASSFGTGSSTENLEASFFIKHLNEIKGIIAYLYEEVELLKTNKFGKGSSVVIYKSNKIFYWIILIFDEKLYTEENFKISIELSEICLFLYERYQHQRYVLDNVDIVLKAVGILAYFYSKTGLESLKAYLKTTYLMLIQSASNYDHNKANFFVSLINRNFTKNINSINDNELKEWFSARKILIEMKFS